MIGRPFVLSRRAWLLGSIVGPAWATASAMGDDRLDAIRTRARKINMEGFDESKSARFVGIGDAPPRFRDQALAICEKVTTDYEKHFQGKGFTLAKPAEKLVVVILRGPRSYAAFEGVMLDEAVGGHYDLDANRLVTFDSRGPGANPISPIPEQDNTFQLVHETMHLLTFNTGILDLKADIPQVVSEGLATYAETWGPRNRGTIGSRNERRLLALKQAFDAGEAWIPLRTLLTDDKSFQDAARVQVAYAVSWLFTFKMIQDRARLPKYREYLGALRDRPDPSRRVEIATSFLGDLDKLDREIRPSR